jgi:hypothetical protein
VRNRGLQRKKKISEDRPVLEKKSSSSRRRIACSSQPYILRCSRWRRLPAVCPSFCWWSFGIRSGFPYMFDEPLFCSANMFIPCFPSAFNEFCYIFPGCRCFSSCQTLSCPGWPSEYSSLLFVKVVLFWWCPLLIPHHNKKSNWKYEYCEYERGMLTSEWVLFKIRRLFWYYYETVPSIIASSSQFYLLLRCFPENRMSFY